MSVPPVQSISPQSTPDDDNLNEFNCLFSNDSSLDVEQHVSEANDILSSDNAVNSPCLHNLLLTTFPTFKNAFNICHINAQSVPQHYSDLLATFSGLNLHALLISETMLKPSLPSHQFPLPGFVLIRNDRVGWRCGGVGIYLRSDLRYKILCQSPSNVRGRPEYLFIEVNLQFTSILLGVVYCPPQINYFQELELLLEGLVPNYEHSVLMGDLNTCLLKQDYRSSKLTQMISSLDLNLLPLKATHYDKASNSLIDLIVTSSSDRINSHGQYTASGFSHHDLLYLSYKIRSPKPPPRFLYRRILRAIDYTQLSHDAYNMEWRNVVHLTSVDEKVELLNKLIIQLYDKHAPIKKIRIKHPASPWITDEIKVLMAKRDKLKSKFKTAPSDELWNSFKLLRNQCNHLCRNAKRSYICSNLANSSPKNTWKFLHSFGVGKTKSNLTNSNFDLNDVNAHFAKPPYILEDDIKAASIQSIREEVPHKVSKFTFSPVRQSEIRRIVKTIKSRAYGCDNLNRDLILPILEIFLPTLTHIINFSIFNSVVPNLWKQAFIIPLPKVQSPDSVKDFRPISILPIFSKVLERVVHTQLNNFLENNKLLDPLQSGFRPGHSTTTVLVKVTDDIRCAMNDRKLTILTLLDFSSAFNSVDFELLLERLCSLNISRGVVRWFDSYLRGRYQCVKSSECQSDLVELTAGVPQGCVLSPLLFSIFINPIAKGLTTSYHLYADDLQIYLHVRPDDLSSAVSTMNLNLDHVSGWAKKHGIIINPAKSQAIVIGGQKLMSTINKSSLPALKINGNIIEYSKTVKNLGIIIDEFLSWQAHTNQISRRIFNGFHSLRRLQRFLPATIKQTIVRTLLLPILDYADVGTIDMNEKILDKFERLQNICIRYIFDLRKFDHVSEYRDELHWLRIRERRNLHALSLLYKVLNSPIAPPYLKEFFHPLGSHGVPLRSSQDNTIAIPLHQTSFYTHSFTVHSARLWNQLPHIIRHATSLPCFKALLRKHFLSQNIR